MATPTLTTDLTTVAIGSMTTDSGTWDGGKAGSEVTYTEGFIQGSECIGWVTNQPSDYQMHYDPPSSINVGDPGVVRVWANTTDPFRCDTKANGGIVTFISDGTNEAEWECDGKDTYYGGWRQYVIDTTHTPDNGTEPTWSAITRIGITNHKLVLGKNVETVFLDAIRYGNVINAYGGTSTSDTIDIAGVYALDLASAYGICWKSLETDAYIIRGELNIGDAVSTNNTYSKIDGEVITGENLEHINAGVLQLNFVGNSTGTNNHQLLNCFISCAASVPMEMNTTDTDIDVLNFDGNTFSNITNIEYQSGFTIKNNKYSDCDQIIPNASTFENNTISNTADTDGALRWTSDCVASDCSFIDNGRAIVVPAAVTSITLDNMIFSGNTTDVYWEGTGGTLTVNLTNGSDASVSGSAGGTVTFVNTVSVTVTVKSNSTGSAIENANVRLMKVSDDSVVLSGLANSSGIVTTSAFAYPGSEVAVYGWVRKATGAPYYKQGNLSGSITSSGYAATILLILDQ